MDKSDHHFYKSIFKKLNPLWWNGEISWRNKYVEGDPNMGFRKLFPNSKINYPVQLTDAWHFFKTLMIVFLALSVITFDNTITSSWYGYLIIFVVYGLIWNLWFNLFYNHILQSEK